VNIVGSLSNWWRARRGDAAVIAVIAIFFIVIFAQVIFGGKFLLAGDPLYYSYPLRSVGWEMLRHGQLPLWTPLVLSGYPLLSMSQLAFAYPLTWGYLFLPGHWAEHIYVLAPFLLSPAFTYAYAREIGRSRMSALLAGLAFGYGGMMCSGISFAGYAPNSMLWLPLVLIPIDRAASRRGRFVPLLTGATAAYSMSVLNGQGQSFLYTGVVAAAYGLYVSLFPREGDAQEAEEENGSSAGDNEAAGRGAWRDWGRQQRRRWRPLFVALGALLMSAGISAFQILETMRAARRSIRSTLSYEEFSSGGFTFSEAVASLFAPLYHSTDVTAYVPPLALLLAVLTCVVALVTRRSETRDARIYFWLGVAVVGWLLMLGDNTPLHTIIYRLPFINKFRVPSRHTFEWTFAVSILAAYGWDIAARWLQKSGHGSPAAARRQRLVVEIIVVGFLLSLPVAVGFLWWRAVQVAPLFGTSNYTGLPESTFLLWKTIFTLCTLLLIWRGWQLDAPRWRTILLMTSIALACVVEPAAAVSRWFEGMLLTADRFSVVSPTTRLLKNFPPEENRVYTRVGLYSDEFTLKPRLEAPNLTALHGIQNIAGYEPLLLERYSRALGGVGLDTVSPRVGYAPNNDLFAAKSRVLDLLNTTHIVSYANLAPNVEPNISKDGISFAPSDTGRTVAPGETVTFGGGAVESDTLALVTLLSNSAELNQGAVVAKVRLHINGAPVIERDVRAGIDTAEWAHERADVRASIKHTLAPVFDSHPGDESNSFSKHHYLARVPLGARVRIEKVEITNITPRSPLNLIKATLHDTASGSSTPLALAASEWWEAVYQKDNALVMHNRRALPRAWLVAGAEAVEAEEALRRIRGESAHAFDPLRTALLEVVPAELPTLAGGELTTGSAAAHIASYEPNRIVIETRAAQPTVLVVSEIIYPGWAATVDGVSTQIHPTNYLLRGVVLPAGEHRVEMRYRAPAARNGALISIFSLLVLGGLLIYARRSRNVIS